MHHVLVKKEIAPVSGGRAFNALFRYHSEKSVRTQKEMVDAQSVDVPDVVTNGATLRASLPSRTKNEGSVNVRPGIEASKMEKRSTRHCEI